MFDEYKDQTFTYARDLIKQLKGEGYVLLAISGSQHEIIEKLAKHHGFDAAVGATVELDQQIDGKYTGNIDTPIFDKAKVLKQFIKTHNLTTTNSYAIGDSKSDVPMLEMVDHPIAFNPDREFFAIAKEHGWKVVVERKNMVFEMGLRGGMWLVEFIAYLTASCYPNIHICRQIHLSASKKSCTRFNACSLERFATISLSQMCKTFQPLLRKRER